MVNNDIVLGIKEIREGLKDKKLYVVSRAIGVSYPTLNKLLNNESHNFTIGTLRKVSDYLLGLSKK